MSIGNIPFSSEILLAIKNFEEISDKIAKNTEIKNDETRASAKSTILKAISELDKIEQEVLKLQEKQNI
jgi:hypothetical protein